MAKDSFKVKKSLNIEPVASPTMDADGDIAVDSSTNRVKVRTNSTTDNVVTDAGTQTLTNKTLTSPTISSPTLSGTLTTPLTASRAVVTGASSELAAATTTATEIGYVNGVTSAIQTQLDAKVAKTLTTTTGDMIYASSANTPARLAIGSSGQVLKTVGGVPTWATFSGGINYLSSNPDAESDTTGWATYADAAASTPVDGTGGSATATFTRSTSSPLRGTGSFMLSKDAANRQGDGASFDFSIDTADQGKPLSVSFDYYVSSGTYATGDVTVYIYDVTNAALIQPSGYQIVSQTVQASHLGCTFQAASNSTSYRLILHIASTSAVAYDLKFDNFYVGPQQRSYGPAMTDWVAYTPTLNSNTGVSTNTAYWRRNGDSLEVQGTVVYSGAGANSAFSSSLPTGLVIDTSKVPTAASEANPLGAASFFDSGSGAKPAITVYNNTTSIYISHATTGVVNTNTMTASDKLEYTYTVPIVGWSSNTLVSSSASTRVVAARFFKSGQSVASGSDVLIQADTVSYDTHGAVTTGASAKFTAPVPGYYRLHGFGQVDATSAFNGTTEVFSLATYVNGASNRTVASMVPPSATVSPILPYTDMRYLNAGDYVDMRAQQTSGSNHNITMVMQVEMVQGPAQIAASEIIAFRAGNTAGTSFTGGGGYADVPFATESFDTHGAFSTPTFTAPAPGLYLFDFNIYTSGVSMTTSQGLSAKLVITGKSAGSFDGFTDWGNASATKQFNVGGSVLVDMNAGDTAKMQVASDVTASLSTTGGRNYFEVHRLGGI